jgi:hypothetical protein
MFVFFWLIEKETGMSHPILCPLSALVILVSTGATVAIGLRQALQVLDIVLA